MTTCPKCGATSGNDWSQCKGFCPMSGSPHHPTGEQARASLRRPKSYNQLTGQQQWEIDKELGILDWDGAADQ